MKISNSISHVLRDQWHINSRVSLSIAKRSLKVGGLASWWWSPVNPRHMQEHLHWWNSRTSWKGVQWSDENQFLLHVIDSRDWVCRVKRTAYHQFNIQEEDSFGDGSVKIWDSYCMTASSVLWYYKETSMAQNTRNKFLEASLHHISMIIYWNYVLMGPVYWHNS